MRYAYKLQTLSSCFVLTAAVLAAVAQTSTHLLRLSDQVGQTNRYRLGFEMQMRAELTGAGQPHERARQLIEALSEGMRIQTAVEYEQRLAAVEIDGTRAFEVRWRGFEYTGEIGGRPIAPPPVQVESTRELLASRAQVRVSPNGRTIDVTYSQPGLASLARQFERLGGAMPTYLPERAVAVGDRWTSTGQFPVGLAAGGTGSLTLELEHTLLEVRAGEDGRLAVIGLSGTFSNLEGIEESGIGAPMHMEASLTGSTLFDIERGRYVGGHYEIDMFALQAAEGIEIQLTGHANGNLELVSAR